MATTVCTQCSKSFRTESGLTWHRRHLHTLGGEADPEQSSVDAASKIELPGSLQAKVENIEDMLFLFVEELAEIRSAAGLDNESNRPVGDRLGELEARIDRTDSNLASLSELSGQLEAQGGRIAVLDRDVSRLRPVVYALCRLNRDLDPTGTQGRSPLVALVGTSPKEIRQRAIDVLREYLQDDSPSG